MDESAVTMLTVTCMGLAAQMWSMGLPERSEVAGWPVDHGHVQVVNGACLSAGTAALVIGAGSSWAARSWWPLLGSVVVVAYLGATYGTAARTGPPSCPPNSSSTGTAPTYPGVRWQA